AVPLPGTGAYAGTAAAWLLDMEPKRAFLAVSLGVTSAFFIVWGLSELVGFGVRSI
ncbi:MAG: small multi-drug export protein, partial [Actinomycetota bacterium]|nr:small multi-drug export protein [Actinomycetota bacterium]